MIRRAQRGTGVPQSCVVRKPVLYAGPQSARPGSFPRQSEHFLARKIGPKRLNIDLLAPPAGSAVIGCDPSPTTAPTEAPRCGARGVSGHRVTASVSQREPSTMSVLTRSRRWREGAA